ncbi:hypothetical protein [Trabulsiella odontotermitis]|uniref:Uncharacterized protein n=1 Tax=Trabulsiella odontotermitis TaxID=379893 RepID=A0A0L0GXR7_9ENTR|nr:hypothetical protein [Trabulsiella odontotermitis]KNC94010.1 hypothetical protein GM31_16690 [Trabulsiella odontotermitis]
MSKISLPEDNTPAEAAHTLVLALVSSGHFDFSGKHPEEIFRIVRQAEREYCRFYQYELKQPPDDEHSLPWWEFFSLHYC